MCVPLHKSSENTEFHIQREIFQEKNELKKTKQTNESSWGLGKGLFPLSADLND